METKRDFLKKLGLLTVGGAVAGSVNPLQAAVSNAKAGGKSIGLQLYSLGRELSANIPAGLKKVAEIGYKTAELAGYGGGKFYDSEVADFKKMAADAGLKITGSHVNPPVRKYTVENKAEIADFWKKTVDDHAKLGVITIVQPGMPSVESNDEAKLVCEVFNNAGEIAKAAGIKWGYHNHSGEFQKAVKDDDKGKRGVQGDIIYDLLLNGTDPKLVFFEMDVYWTVMGQQDPLYYFDKYAGRFPVLHIKDRSVLGQSGMMNFENIFNRAYKNGLDEFYVEIEGIKTGMTQFEGVKQCFDYLNNASFVK